MSKNLLLRPHASLLAASLLLVSCDNPPEQKEGQQAETATPVISPSAAASGASVTLQARRRPEYMDSELEKYVAKTASQLGHENRREIRGAAERVTSLAVHFGRSTWTSSEFSRQFSPVAFNACARHEDKTVSGVKVTVSVPEGMRVLAVSPITGKQGCIVGALDVGSTPDPTPRRIPIRFEAGSRTETVELVVQ